LQAHVVEVPISLALPATLDIRKRAAVSDQGENGITVGKV
jgi:hypothetical protein